MRYNATHSIIAIAAAVSSYLLFHFQNMVIEFVSSEDICRSSATDILKWIIPKLMFRCDWINDVQSADIPSISIVIVLDVWIVSCCILCFVYYLFKLRRLTEKDLLDYWYLMKQNKRRLNGSILFWRALLVLLLAFVFVYSPAIDDGYAFGFVSLLSNYGIGVVMQAMIATVPPHAVFVLGVAGGVLKTCAERNL